MITEPVLSATDYLALPRDVNNWLLHPLLPVGGSMELYGDPKVGKSYAALQLALVLTGAGPSDWFGFPTQATGRVVYVQLDTPRSLWAERLAALKHAGHPIEALYLADRETLQTWPFDVLNPDHECLLRAALVPLNPVAVIIDTLKESNSAPENDNTEMTTAVNKLISITQPAALILIHHAKKPGELERDVINDSRGAGATPGKMDAICRLSKKGLHYVGRGIEEGFIELVRGDDGFWVEPDHNNLVSLIDRILSDHNLHSDRERAAALAPLLGRSEEAARSAIRRFRAGISTRTGCKTA